MVLKCADSPSCWKSRATLLHVTGNVLFRGVWMSCLSPAPRLNSFCEESEAAYTQAPKHFQGHLAWRGKTSKKDLAWDLPAAETAKTFERTRQISFTCSGNTVSLWQAHHFRLLTLKRHSMCACCWNTRKWEAWCNSLSTCCFEKFQGWGDA